MATGKPLPGDRLRIINDAGDQISAGPCKGQVATLIADDGSDCPYFVAIDDGSMSWAKLTAFDTTKFEPFDLERVQSAFRLASHCVAPESWDRLAALAEQVEPEMRGQSSQGVQPRDVHAKPWDLSAKNLALMAAEHNRGAPNLQRQSSGSTEEAVTGRAVDDEEAAFFSLLDKQPYSGPVRQRPNQGPSQGYPWDSKHAKAKRKVMRDRRNFQTRVTSDSPNAWKGENKLEGMAQWMINHCEIGPEDARHYAAALVDIGCDRPKDLAEMDQEDWPIEIKKMHVKKIMKVLSLSSRPMSDDQFRYSGNTQMPYDGRSQKNFFLPVPSGYAGAGRVHISHIYQGMSYT